MQHFQFVDSLFVDLPFIFMTVSLAYQEILLHKNSLKNLQTLYTVHLFDVAVKLRNGYMCL